MFFQLFSFRFPQCAGSETRMIGGYTFAPGTRHGKETKSHGNASTACAPSRWMGEEPHKVDQRRSQAKAPHLTVETFNPGVERNGIYASGGRSDPNDGKEGEGRRDRVTKPVLVLL